MGGINFNQIKVGGFIDRKETENIVIRYRITSIDNKVYNCGWNTYAKFCEVVATKSKDGYDYSFLGKKEIKFFENESSGKPSEYITLDNYTYAE